MENGKLHEKKDRIYISGIGKTKMGDTSIRYELSEVKHLWKDYFLDKIEVNTNYLSTGKSLCVFEEHSLTDYLRIWANGINMINVNDCFMVRINLKFNHIINGKEVKSMDIKINHPAFYNISEMTISIYEPKFITLIDDNVFIEFMNSFDFKDTDNKEMIGGEEFFIDVDFEIVKFDNLEFNKPLASFSFNRPNVEYATITPNNRVEMDSESGVYPIIRHKISDKGLKFFTDNKYEYDVDNLITYEFPLSNHQTDKATIKCSKRVNAVDNCLYDTAAFESINLMNLLFRLSSIDTVNKDKLNEQLKTFYNNLKNNTNGVDYYIGIVYFTFYLKNGKRENLVLYCMYSNSHANMHNFPSLIIINQSIPKSFIEFLDNMIESANSYEDFKQIGFSNRLDLLFMGDFIPLASM